MSIPNSCSLITNLSAKPVLADTFSESKLWFNLTHSQGLALCAVSCDRQIGVDLEYVRSISDVLTLAERYFSPREYDVMRSLPPNQIEEVFFPLLDLQRSLSKSNRSRTCPIRANRDFTDSRRTGKTRHRATVDPIRTSS